MKKVFLFLLTFFLCASICACGGEAPAVTTAPETFPAPAITDHPLLDSACGQWILSNPEDREYHFYQELTIRGDGTCQVNGEELVWQIDESTQDDQLVLYFYRDSERVCGAIYYEEYDRIADLSGMGMVYPSGFINTARASAAELQTADPDTYRVPLVTGQWLLAESAEGVPGSMTFREDKTCTIDEVDYTWEFSFNNGNSFGIHVLEGETVKYELSVPVYNQLEQVIILYTEDDRGVYINPDHYDIIEITPENWLDYFEISSYATWQEDAFGTVERMSTHYYTITLKEEYALRLSSAVTGGDLLTRNAMEVSYSYGTQQCQVQLQEKVCTPIEGTYVFEKTITETDTFLHRIHPVEYSMSLFGYPYGADEDRIPVLSDFQLLRVNCPLYLIKEEYRVEQ